MTFHARRGALLRLHCGALAADPDLRAIMDEVIEEAFAVVARLKVPVPFKTPGEISRDFLREAGAVEV